MTRLLSFLLLLSIPAGASELPAISFASAKWAGTEGASISDGVVSLHGSAKGYVRATLALPGEAVAGKTLRFSAEVMTEGIEQGQDIVYASPKLKVIDMESKSVLAVNNFGSEARRTWTPMAVEVTIPSDHRGPISLEIGLQLCRGLFKARAVSIAAVKPWRWRVLDGNHRSYFDK